MTYNVEEPEASAETSESDVLSNLEEVRPKGRKVSSTSLEHHHTGMNAWTVDPPQPKYHSVLDLETENVDEPDKANEIREIILLSEDPNWDQVLNPRPASMIPGLGLRDSNFLRLVREAVMQVSRHDAIAFDCVFDVEGMTPVLIRVMS